METDSKEISNIFTDCIDEPESAVNNLILEYYKKFGRKRDLEQFFSLSTAQSDIRDPSSLFWKKMKSQTDSDSGEKKSESLEELCRISITCSIPGEPSTSQVGSHTQNDSESPPIINEDEECISRNSDNESVKSYDMNSQKSIDNTLDTSINKPHSPTSSITSQRKLEWDSLADVGYANESDRKNSASSLSTLERLALHQQYANNDTKQNLDIGPPTAQSTPLDIEENKNKHRQGFSKKTTKIFKKDVDLVELKVPNNENLPQPINVNLTKHISFNVERDGGITVENIMKSVSVSPEKLFSQAELPQEKSDKEIQTTLNKHKDKSSSSSEQKCKKQYPVLISLNTLKKRTRKRKARKIQRKRTKKRLADKENVPIEKSGDQLSEAESFEYMPGHIYNLNQMKKTNKVANRLCNNKSSQESSAGITTDSSRTSRHSFTKDLEKSIDILKIALDNRCEDEKLKKKLVKELVQRLIKSKYREDESSTEFLSGLSFDSKKMDIRNSNHTTSTSDTNNTAKPKEPKKSILRIDKFNSSAIASTSQSVPNLPTVTKNENTPPYYSKRPSDLSNTDSDLDKTKNLSFNVVDKASSEELYKKYLDALRREQAYKKHLKDKELFLKQKLASSDTAFNVMRQATLKEQKLKDVMKDLVSNNYDGGSGDASKLEGSYTNFNLEKYNSMRKQRSHSVFTLSSGNSDNNKQNMCSNTKSNLHHKSSSKNIDEHYCCCPFHKTRHRVGVVDSSVQVNMTPKDVPYPEQMTNLSQNAKTRENIDNTCDKCKLHQNEPQIVTDPISGEIKYVCLCANDNHEEPENFLIYKCSKLNNQCLKIGGAISRKTHSKEQTSSDSTTSHQKSSFKGEDCDTKCMTFPDNMNQMSKSSQTNLNLPIKLLSRSSEQSVKSTSSSSSSNKSHNKLDNFVSKTVDDKLILIHEATRWIQTEISIDPKISDPSLSDINIINNKDCVHLVGEQYKKVSRSNSENRMVKEFHENTKSKCSSRANKSDKAEEKLSANDGLKDRKEPVQIVEKIDKEIQIVPDEVQNKFSSSNFTIPIQGTNMTLKVSLGSGTVGTTQTLGNKLDSIVTQVSRGTDTVKNDVVENYTSLTEECSKGVQSENANIFDEFYHKSATTFKDENADTKNLVTENEKELNNKALPYSVNTYITENFKYSTYPKVDRSLTQRQLLRSNTDTDRIEAAIQGTFQTKSTKDNVYQPINVLTQNEPKAVVAENFVDAGSEKSLKFVESIKSKTSTDADEQSSKASNSDAKNNKMSSKDPIIEMIQDITKRYSKKDVEKSKRKKCFKEIITVLNYLLDTEESTDDRNKGSSSSACENASTGKNFSEKDSSQSLRHKTLVDKGIQLSAKKSKARKARTESSDMPISTDVPSTSTDSGTCKILNKIKRECERYHQKRCNCNEGKACESSSSTAFNCHHCRHAHHCSCKSHKCKNHKKAGEKLKQKCVAYNLIIQTSDSMVSEEVNYDSNKRPLKNIIVKVPSKRKVQNMPFKEISSKIESHMPDTSPHNLNNNYHAKTFRNDSEISSTDDVIKKTQACTVREYLEKNRPDFVEKSSNRQHCLKVINETRTRENSPPRLNMIVVHAMPNTCVEPYNMCFQGVPINSCMCTDPSPFMHCIQNEVTRVANERAAKRQLLSMQLDRQQALSALSRDELERFARELGNELRRKKVAPKFISEREMKKHSEKIYKSLPEVVRKKEEIKKENIKKTNLLMANIFKKNLQKKTLQGAVNLSNYSTVVKI